MGDRTVPGERCPQCSAALRPGAPWCTQCYAQVGGTTGEPARASAAVAATASAPTGGADPLPTRPADGAASAGASWPCDACGAANPLAEASCASCGAAFLARARGTRPALVLPVVGDVSALTPVRLVVLALALVVALLLAAVAGGALLG